MHEVLEVVWPRGKITMENPGFAKRLDTLSGKTVCELWDWRFRGDEMFPVIEKELAKRYPGIKFVSYEKFGCTHEQFGSTQEAGEREVLAALPDKLKQYKCDAAISGVGC